MCECVCCVGSARMHREGCTDTAHTAQPVAISVTNATKIGLEPRADVWHTRSGRRAAIPTNVQRITIAKRGYAKNTLELVAGSDSLRPGSGHRSGQWRRCRVGYCLAIGF